MEKNPLPHGEAFIITQGERERKGDVPDQKQGKEDSTGKGRKPVEEGRETRRGTGRFSTGKKKKRQ